MFSQNSSNSQFFQWIQATANNSINSGTNAIVRLGNRLHHDSIEFKKRKSLYKLLNASDEHLKDVGLERADLKMALDLPLNINAGRWLERRRAKG